VLKDYQFFYQSALNKTIRFSFDLNESDFKTFVRFNISTFYLSFQRILKSSYSEIGKDEEELAELNEFED
jgi:hypothetical protein